MSDSSRIRINLAQREVEVAGSEAFVERWAGKLEGMLSALTHAPMPATAPAASPAAVVTAPARPERWQEFGAYIQALPSTATDVDRMLAAGFWVQRNSGDESFATAEATKRLDEHGIRIGNPSQCVKQSVNAKRVYKGGNGRWKISAQGREYLRRFLSELVDG